MFTFLANIFIKRHRLDSIINGNNFTRRIVNRLTSTCGPEVISLEWDDPFLIGFGAVFGVMAMMFIGQVGYRIVTERRLRRDDRARRRMRKLRAVPIAPRRSDPAESNEE